MDVCVCCHRKQRAEKQFNPMTEGVIWKQLLYFFFPILLGTFFQQCYNTVDAIIVGKFVGKEALAAVGGATGSIINMFVGFFTGLASGASVVISQYFGAKAGENVSKSVHTAIALGIVLSVILMIGGYVAAPYVLTAMDTPADIMDDSLTYLRIYFLGIGGMLLYNIGTGILRAIGDSKRPMYYLITCCVTNILLDLLFVVAFGWGVVGVAVATLLAQVISAALVLGALMRSKGMLYQLRIGSTRFDWRILKNILKIGFPVGLQTMMFNVTNVLIQASINGLGTDVVAGWTAYLKVVGILGMFDTSYGVAVTSFSGQNFGAQRYDRVRKCARVGLAMSMTTIGILCIVVPLLGRQILGLFTNDAVVVEKGLEIMNVIIPLYWTSICHEVLSGAIHGTGDVKIPTVITCVGICVLRVILVLAVVPLLPGNVKAVAACYPITWSVTSTMFVIYYLRGGWMKRQIAANGFEEEKAA